VLQRYKVPANAARVKSGRGEIVAWAVTPTLVVQVATGHGDALLAEGFLKEQAALLAGRRGVTVFFDGLAFTGYDSGFRTPLSASARTLVDSGQLKGILLLTQSKLVAMGAAVVNLVLGSKIEVFADPKVFDRRLVDFGGGAALDRARATG
jgi:hypothetical protein